MDVVPTSLLVALPTEHEERAVVAVVELGQPDRADDVAPY